uniref:Uncharacterized protein n=1 Tax=Oryza meridionalis TaxID=40149 RepID=A0A0E0EP92_9ORYZ
MTARREFIMKTLGKVGYQWAVGQRKEMDRAMVKVRKEGLAATQGNKLYRGTGAGHHVPWIPWHGRMRNN